MTDDVSKHLIELRDILSNLEKPFGGKPVMLGGDFRQTLPVKKKATKSEIIASSIARSHLWRHFKLYKLTRNMRVLKTDLNEEERRATTEFSAWILDIGDGKAGEPDEQDPQEGSWISIPVGREGAASEMLYPPEYLNTFKFPGLPPNKLQLKIGVPIMLLKNVNLAGGL